ncbi:Centrosomal protein of 97 kDa-like Protein [Tribolium castaneum]|uniref:Centrosomal protein of 97 kDa n=1 Tax=Tribolium castaneum TaxID=7070 RepID=D2A2T5_TRICA|nr:PREDICTED: centrosomal protein of 97 kDa isoform X1 [Tribolium castaneum]XP_968521.1 PREDICTED: centrosomal protein of 97 kDa isoform X1 [Tribolium castaneum]EFA01464.1 Centrosomal protein of 97 kDa-like Protein [Tribolium castaneum]|eukprot:XP_008192430.1 PREDICTED: centrosomal protein of 97 kDa isoform X1 [Tribolium castaneum]
MEEISDLSNKKLKKLAKFSPQESQVITTLILDDNELQRLDNIDSLFRLQKLSAVRNQLLRMYGVCRLHSLHTLNLAHNGILTIEGLKDLVNLKWLCLAGNSIKTIEHLNTNTNLEHLDLSENNITHINDLAFLKDLKELFLHNNKINHLRQSDRFLPTSLITLTLANNNIEDLNEISQLVHLVNLQNISIANNPCVNFGNTNIGFDYRPFVINWCLNIKTIDGYVVDAIESLRAEWLYSQGRGRHFRVGDQKDLVQYLASVCPLTGEALETEEDRKLRLILSKAQHHQQQLREQSTGSSNPSPLTRKKLHGAKHSPRLNSARATAKLRSPDRMSSSCYGNANVMENSNIMSQSLDPTILRQSVTPSKTPSEKRLDDEPVNSPLQALSKMVPVPESLMSPDYRPAPILGKTVLTSVNNKKLPQAVRSPKLGRNLHNKNKPQANDGGKSSSPSPARARKAMNHENNANKTSILRKSLSSDDESEVFVSKLQKIQIRAEEKRIMNQKDAEILNNCNSEDRVEQAAVFIQKMWRGYFTRNRNKEVQEIFRTLQAQRANQYIQQLTDDMETTKAALESERKIQMLQTEAISALWKQMSALQPNSGQSSTANMTNLSTDNVEVVKELAKTCTVLQNQIQQLQSSMQDIVKVMTVFSQTTSINPNGIATQTEIVAVHTPQGEAAKVFPFHKQTRPSSLPLPINQRKKDNVNTELQQYADNLVDGVIKTVSETRADCVGSDLTEITVTDTAKMDETQVSN